MNVRARSRQRAAGLPEVLARDHGRHGDCPGRLADLYAHQRKCNALVMGAFGAVVLAVGIFLVHRQVERRIDQIGKL